MERKRTPAITRDPETHSGAPVFTGTRIVVKVLFGLVRQERLVSRASWERESRLAGHDRGVARKKLTSILPVVGYRHGHGEVLNHP